MRTGISPLRSSKRLCIGAKLRIRHDVQTIDPSTRHAAASHHPDNPVCARKSLASLSCGPCGYASAASVQPTSSTQANTPVTSTASIDPIATAAPKSSSSLADPATAIQLSCLALNAPASCTWGTALSSTNSRTSPPNHNPAATCPNSWIVRQRKESRTA